MDNNDNKKVDGIRKLSGEELRLSREVVLKSIEEASKKEAEAQKEEGKILKRVDGIFHLQKKKSETAPSKSEKKEVTPDQKNVTVKKVVVKQESLPAPLEPPKKEEIKPDKEKQRIWQAAMEGMEETEKDEAKKEKVEVKIDQKQERTKQIEEEKRLAQEKENQIQREKELARRTEEEQKEKEKQEKRVAKERSREEKRLAKEHKRQEKIRLKEERKRQAEEARRKREEEKIRQEEEEMKHKKMLAEKKEHLKQEKIRLKEEAKKRKQEEKARRQAEKEKARQLAREEKIRLAKMSKEERERAKQEKIKQEEEAARLAQAEKKRFAEEKRRLALEKTAAKERERKERQAEKEKEKAARILLKKQRSLARQKKIRHWRHQFIQKSKQLKIGFISALKKMFVVGFVLLLLSLAIYSIFVFLVTKFEFDNKITRILSQVMPVPALVTKSGIVEYYRYQDLKVARFLESDLSREEVETKLKLDLLKELILNSLAQKYKVENREELFLSAEVAEAMAHDLEINKVPFSRIKRIKDMLDQGKSFIEAAKYGDEQGKVDINSQNYDFYSYGAQVKDLDLYEISDIIITREGYYIFRAYVKNKDNLALSYVFVRALDLNTYIEDQVGQCKLWSLVD